MMEEEDLDQGFDFSLRFILALFVCMHVCMCLGVCRCPWSPEGSVGSLQARATGSCELPSVGAGYQTLILCKCSESS